MSSQSILKPIYDRYARDYFLGGGGSSWIITKSGRFCDVISINGNDIAVIEVKSPAEGSVVSNYNDMRNLSANVAATLPADYQHRRRTICAAIPRQPGVSIIKLYGVSVACQLLRYVREYDALRSSYEAITGNNLGCSQSHSIVPYFVVPIELEPQANNALLFLQQQGMITSFTSTTTCRLFVTKIDY